MILGAVIIQGNARAWPPPEPPAGKTSWPLIASAFDNITCGFAFSVSPIFMARVLLTYQYLVKNSEFKLKLFPIKVYKNGVLRACDRRVY